MLTKVRLNKIVEHANLGNKNIYHKILNLFTKHLILESVGDFEFVTGKGKKGKRIVILSIQLPMLIHKPKALY